MEVGGAETNLTRLLPSLEKEFENGVICLMGEGTLSKRFEENNIPVHYLHLKGIFDFFNPRVIFGFRKRTERNKEQIKKMDIGNCLDTWDLEFGTWGFSRSARVMSCLLKNEPVSY